MAKKDVEVKENDSKKELKDFLVRVMPSMFNRTPDITGDLDKFADEIIKIVK